MTNQYRLLTATILLAGVLGLAVPTTPSLILDWVIVPADAHCAGKHTGEHRHCTNPPSIPPPDVFEATHAVDLGCKEEKPNCQAAFFDLGTDLGPEASLPCVSNESVGGVTCGHDSDFNPSDPRPQVDINNLSTNLTWSGGNYLKCFGNGSNIQLIAPWVSVGEGTAGEYNVAFFFQGGVDTGVSAKCSGADDTSVRYEARIGPCQLSDDSVPFPPSATDDEAIITCGITSPDPAKATVRQTSGGGKLKTCGCEASGTLPTATTIWVRGL